MIVAPTDPQLNYLAVLARERGMSPADLVVWSKDATRCISALLDGSFDPAEYAPGADLPECLRP